MECSFVTYQNICVLCNPEGGGKKAKLVEGLDQPSDYIGESGRSLLERGREHWKDFTEKKEESHIWYHHQLHHGGVGDPKFHQTAQTGS